MKVYQRRRPTHSSRRLASAGSRVLHFRGVCFSHSGSVLCSIARYPAVFRSKSAGSRVCSRRVIFSHSGHAFLHSYYTQQCSSRRSKRADCRMRSRDGSVRFSHFDPVFLFHLIPRSVLTVSTYDGTILRSFASVSCISFSRFYIIDCLLQEQKRKWR